MAAHALSRESPARSSRRAAAGLALTALLLVGGAARAAPVPVAVDQVFRAGDEVESTLRKAEAAAQVDTTADVVELQLAAAERNAAGLGSDLQAQPLASASAREIERLRQAIAHEDALLAGGQDALAGRSDLLGAALRELGAHRETWSLTAEAAAREAAPAPVLRRISQVEGSLLSEASRLEARQERLLELQGRVSDLRAELSRMAALVAAAETDLKQQLFEAESAPLWRALARPDGATALGGQLRQGVRESVKDVASFVREEAVSLWLHLAIVLALGLGLMAIRRLIASLGAEEPALRSAVHVLARPWSAALLLSLATTRWLYPPLLPALRDLAFLAVLAPLLRLLPRLVPELARRPLYGLAALFALARVASLAPPRTLLARLLVLLVSTLAVVGLTRGLRRGGWARFAHGGPWGAAARASATVALALVASAIVLNLIGNATLAERLTHATLTSAALGAVLLGVRVVAEGALAALLHVPAVARRPLVARHRALLERRAASVLRLGLAAFWAWRTVVELGVDEAAGAAVRGVLELRLAVGGLDVSLGNVVAFLVTLAVAFSLSRAVRFVLDEGVFAELALPRGIPTAVSTTVQYGLVVMGFFWAVLASGMEMNRFSFLLGALGVGIGLGLQGVVNNLVSGLILLYERPVHVGDVVEIGLVTGEVTRIGVRSSTVRTFAGAEVIVPNASFISSEVTNWTLSDPRRRVELAVGVAYGTPPQQVIDLLLAAVQGRDGVLSTPPPTALFLRFGESSLDFVLRFWTADFERWQVIASEVMIEVHASLGRAGIEIPFPQRDLHVRSVDAASAETLARVQPGPGPERAPGAGRDLDAPRHE